LFWFYSAELNQVDLVFCKPRISLWNVVAVADLASGLIDYVQLLDQNVAANNVSGPPMNGVAMNGINFATPDSSALVAARAASINGGVPAALYHGSNAFGGPTSVFQSAGGFTSVANVVYTQFLAVAAVSTYFVAPPPDIATITSTVQYSEVRLYVYSVAAHLFAAAMIVIALVAIYVHRVHYIARRQTPLATDPSTIAAVISLTSGAGIEHRLRSGMTEKELEEALRGLRFEISPTTGTIVAVGPDAESVAHGQGIRMNQYPSSGGGTLPYNPKRTSGVLDPKDVKQ